MAMGEPSAAAKTLPVVPFLKIPEQGDPYLEGSRCRACGAVYLGQRSVCGACTARDAMATFTLSNHGELYVYSIVHRSFPGVETPYVSAVVDLDGGGTIKGNLVDIEPDPERIRLGMRVEVVYRPAGRKDGEGNDYLAYFFRPAPV